MVTEIASGPPSSTMLSNYHVAWLDAYGSRFCAPFFYGIAVRRYHLVMKFFIGGLSACAQSSLRIYFSWLMTTAKLLTTNRWRKVVIAIIRRHQKWKKNKKRRRNPLSKSWRQWNSIHDRKLVWAGKHNTFTFSITDRSSTWRIAS